jgi:hypothetical protein
MLACAPPHSVIQHFRKSTTHQMVLAIAASMVLLRALPYLLFEQLAFDSDQAINGLMTKHLIEGRAFPLFFYGQTYMLAVEAWAAAPFFLIGGATVTSLRLSILAWNIAFVWLVIEALRRDGAINPWWTLVPASLLALAPPSVATQLMAAQGGIVEPFVWIVALWLLRRRPLWFGLVFAIAFRNREFTAYAIPALLAVELAAGEFSSARLRQWLAAGVIFMIGWQTIEVIKPRADLLGPGTRGQFIVGLAESQITNLVERADFDRAALIQRTEQLVPQILKWFSGAEQLDTRLPISHHPWLAWTAGAAFIAATLRLIILLVGASRGNQERGIAWRVRARIRTAGFAFYLIGVGATAIAAFVASKPVLNGYSRYALLGLLLPVGVVAAVLSVERSTALRRLVAGGVVAWALVIAGDHALVASRYIRHPLPNQSRVLADQLISEGTSAAIADYWHAYLVTFVARERVRIASSDFVRIQEYQDAFEQQAPPRVVLSEKPCTGGRVVSGVYICRP